MQLDLSLRLIAIIFLAALWYWYKQKDKPNPKCWRIALYKRHLRRWYENFDWRRDLPNMRPLLLLMLAGIVYVATRYFLPSFDLNQLAKLEKAGDATLLLALMGSPFAFAVWWFKDTNNREQIENQRKDVNLKDFQRLAEWAAGMHLPEDKITNSLKTTQSATVEPKTDSTETKTTNITENSQSTEYYCIPSNAILHTPSRREGAASLQIAAIYQLQNFLQGDYGKHFQRPAFQLLKSVWLSLVGQHRDALNRLLEEQADFHIFEIQKWRTELQNTMAQPVGQALNLALGAQKGYLLRTHEIDLPNMVLTGFNSLHAALELDDLNLTGIQLQGADLRLVRLQRTDLKFAQLQGANLSQTELQEANLDTAQLRWADLRQAELQGANLDWAYLQGSDLRGAQLQGSSLKNIMVNKKTDFRGSQTDDKTQVFVEDFKIHKLPVDLAKTFALRDQLRDENGLKLPDILYQQLFTEPTEYSVITTDGQKVTRRDVGKRQ